MNLTVFTYNYLLPLRKLGWLDLGFHVMIFLFCFLYVMLGETGINLIFDFVSSPLLLFLLTYKYISDKGQAYNALLFTRPLTRVSYVITKAFVGSVAMQVFVWKVLIFTLISELLLGTKPMLFLSGWEIASIAANAFCFSCLGLMISSLPTKMVQWACVVFSITLVTPSLTYRPVGPLREIPLQSTESTFSWLGQVFYPYIDLETCLHSTAVSYIPLIAYLSNIAIYIFIATWLINRKEFSYAQD